MFKVCLFEIHHLLIFNNSFLLLDLEIIDHNHQNTKYH